ncbi:Fpg/Nei family DNA glycosylase [Allostreptomyces psammosilenae]|uniref:DNA-(apurinic or apyrimidinic site) lyase n=1 Tax=Allostreptomyces psammosilenae TaxID=1892865 RepID=A0A853A1X9_9ACTN|nr:Fpg/Nei family DNA glycosylase [Allostreptomyces psammosilenae]NYI08389.1 endonuclease-8 [Allostreptomyces psammosilenae]
MPEGHTIHRLAAACIDHFAGRKLLVSSPQGRFGQGAARLDGLPLAGADAHGKHLFLRFGTDPDEPVHRLHIHLGLYGKVTFGTGPVPPPTGQIRLRLATGEAVATDTTAAGDDGRWMDLRGPTACELLDPAEEAAIHARLGADPLLPPDDPRADPEPARRRIAHSRTTIAALLMDQSVIAGAGNVYRAEVLFRQGIEPHRPGRDVTAEEWERVWADLRALMAEGVRTGRIDTVRPEHTPEAMGRPPRVDDHGGEVYVYRRAGMPCLICGTPVATESHAARNLFWCPTCQAR